MRTFHLATLPEQDLLSRLGANRPLPPFAAVAESSRDARARMTGGESDEIAAFHAVRLYLRQLYLNGHNLQDALVFSTLLAHHPHPVTMAQVRRDTALARQTAHRALTSHPHLIVQIKEPTPNIVARLVHPATYRFTPLGVQTALHYLRTLLKPCRPSPKS